jgi:TetR/AcrR family transcriptional regulator
MAANDPNASSRSKIIEVAEALYARRGFAGVGMREVADAAGLGKSSLFHHFRSKVQLYLAVLERVLARMEERLAPILTSPLGAADKLDRWIDELVDTIAEQPATARILLRAICEEDEFDGEVWPEGQAVDRHLAAVIEGITRVLDDGMRAGELRRASTPHLVQTLIGATVYHFASGEIGAGILGTPLLSADAVGARKSEIKALLHHGLAACPAPSAEGERS